MNATILKQALLAARDRLIAYNKIQRMHSLHGKGSAVDNAADQGVLEKIEAALKELQGAGREGRKPRPRR